MHNPELIAKFPIPLSQAGINALGNFPDEITDTVITRAVFLARRREERYKLPKNHIPTGPGQRRQELKAGDKMLEVDRIDIEHAVAESRGLTVGSSKQAKAIDAR